MIRDLFEYRHFLRLLVYRDLKMRYAGSLLGSFWNLINPLILVGIYILVFGQLMSGISASVDRTGGLSRLDYAVHLCAGIIPWLLFSEILSRSSNVLLENANFLRKLAFPAVILPISVFINALILHSISGLFLIGLLAVLGGGVSPNVLLYFLVMLGMGLTALGLGMIVAVVNVYFRDFGQFLQIVLQFMFWMLPIIWYREDMGPLIQKVADLNPLSYFVRAGQAVLSSGPHTVSPRGNPVLPPGVQNIPHMVLLPLVALLLGYIFFKNQRRAVLDEL